MKALHRIGKTIKWEAAHVLKGLPPGHPCGCVHGHSYKAEIVLYGEQLDETGFLVDFNVLKVVRNALDHKLLNDLPGFKEKNPSAENIAGWIAEKVCDLLLQLQADQDVGLESVTVFETESSWAQIVLPMKELG